jgi:hypothetical protein
MVARKIVLLWQSRVPRCSREPNRLGVGQNTAPKRFLTRKYLAAAVNEVGGARMVARKIVKMCYDQHQRHRTRRIMCWPEAQRSTKAKSVVRSTFQVSCKPWDIYIVLAKTLVSILVTPR